jgi:hypothetical protein
MSVFFIKINTMIKRENTTVKKDTLIDVSNDKEGEKVNLGEKNITVAFRVSDNNGQVTLEDPKFGYWGLQ